MVSFFKNLTIRCFMATILLCCLILGGCTDSSQTSDVNDDIDVEEDEVTRYKVDYCGEKDMFKKARNSYEAGQKVKLYYDLIATDTDYTFYLDDEILNVDYSEDKGFIITFTMPEHDVTLRVESVNSMEPVIEPEADELMELLLAESGSSEEDVVCFERVDLDSDGNDEAFAIIGNSIDYDFDAVNEGSAWFVSENECKKLFTSSGMGLRNEIRFMTIGDTEYVLFDDLYVSESYSLVYYMSGGEIHETVFSHIGSVWPDENDPNRFTVTDSSYDMTFDNTIGAMIGHTWKKYYFFYDSEDGLIHEYAGTSIDAATVKYWCGRDLVSELIPKGDTVDTIFMRGNGMIVINYEHTDEDGSINYYHYIYSTTKESFVDDMGTQTDTEPLCGICYSCLIPGMASYPEVPGPNDAVWYGE